MAEPSFARGANVNDRLHETERDRDADQCACDAEPSIGGRIGDHFDSRVRRAGPGAGSSLHKTSLALLGLMGDPTERTILEIGCGRGGLLLELLRSGAAGASGLDLSRASVDQARARFATVGLADRVTLQVGDGAKVPLEPHDWVVLDRAICCYPDADGLVANSIPAARKLFAFSVPNSRGWRGLAARIGRQLDNGWNGLCGRSCKTFVHDLGQLDRTLTAAGFSLRGQGTRGLWYVAVYERRAARATRRPDTTGNPSAAQASKPPTISVARVKPRSCSVAAAMLDE
jgi:magnesium-protoporphyrin O-methyltransferase